VRSVEQTDDGDREQVVDDGDGRSTTATVSRNDRRAGVTRGPSVASTASAKTMSVAAGIAQPPRALGSPPATAR